MKTIKLIKLIICLGVFLFSFNSNAQKLGNILKKKAKEAIEEAVNKDSGKEKEKGIIIQKESKTVNNDFITGAIIFKDNFNSEKQGEFPSKWTHLSGTLQNSQVNIAGKTEGVIEFMNTSRIKPTFKTDDYLGDSFKIEGQFFFHGKGNESYTFNLMNNSDAYKNFDITIRGDGIVPAGSSSQYARMPNKMPYPGWRTVQLSFNKGTLKVFYEGVQLINIPELKNGSNKHLTEFTHLELSALSRAGQYTAMANHITISHKGLPLYKKLVSDGRLIFHDILFDVDSYLIKPSSYPSLNKIYGMLESNPKTLITIEGHTDANGSNSFNKTLSKNRAKAVKNYLVIKGINENRMKTVGYGEERPIDRRNNEKAWAKNRRVEIVLEN